MKNDCKHYDKELDCCKWLSDWGQAMPVLQPCVESPCDHYKSKTGECPFCGGNVEIEANYLGQIYAHCKQCGAKVTGIYYDNNDFVYYVCVGRLHFTLQQSETYFTREEAEQALKGVCNDKQ